MGAFVGIWGIEWRRGGEELTTTHDGDVDWMGFPVVVTDDVARRNSKIKVGFTACRIDQVEKKYAEQIADAKAKWNALRHATKVTHDVDIGDGDLLFASDYR
jgi:predicted RNA-binding protein with TRAM domain